MTDTNGRVAFVTGASSGIGRATAIAFAREGYQVAVAARRTDRLDAVRAEIGENAFSVQSDVRDVSSAENAVKAVHGHFGRIDILVNNAGLARGLRPVESGDEEEWRQMVETNVMGLLWITRLTIPVMKAAGTGHIINIGSVAGHESYAGGSVYAGTKHAVRAITQSLRLELLGTGIRVTSVDPGMTETEFSMVRFGGDEARSSAVYKGVEPLAGEDVAECIVFAASRPAHVNVDEIMVKPTAQASAGTVHRTA